MPTFELDEGTPQADAFFSTKPIQLLAGGYGWGKTALLCVKCIDLMQKYPGARGAILRNTLPNLETTTQKEFMKWCPKHLIKRMPSARNRTLEFTNGSEVLFNYIALTRRGDSETMNMLSATFDFVFIDQLEDPEFTYKLFQDLQGRMRGTAKYVGDDTSMPKYCNYFMATTNPTQNWVNTKLVRPLKVWKETGVVLPELLKDEKLYAETGKVEPIIDLIEGTTYDNKRHLPEGFIERLENIYTGAMRDKYMLGKWDVAENLVYPMFNYAVHVVDEFDMEDKMKRCREQYRMAWKESLDFGIASPSCYLIGFVDEDENIHLIDGYYEKEKDIRTQAGLIKDLRYKYDISPNERVISDPALFRRSAVDTTVADTFAKYGIDMDRGNNNILGGIGKVGDYLRIDPFRRNPYTGGIGAPRLYISNKLTWLVDEIVDYRWKVTMDGAQDKPVDKNDHAMDAMKYMLTFDDDKARLIQKQIQFQQEIRRWRPVSSTQK